MGCGGWWGACVSGLGGCSPACCVCVCVCVCVQRARPTLTTKFMGSLGNPGTFEVKNFSMTDRLPLALSLPSAGPSTITGFTVASSKALPAGRARTKSHAARSARHLDLM